MATLVASVAVTCWVIVNSGYVVEESANDAQFF
jgi:hypothetical protein